MISTTPGSEKEDRRLQRIALALPVRIESKIDHNSSWNEVTRLKDVSAYGAGFFLNRPVKRGRLIVMTIPMPRQLRCYDHLEPQYRVWGLVRKCINIKENGFNAEQYAIGVAFIGKHPPLSYQQNPARLFETKQLAEKGFWQIGEAPSRPDERHLPKELRRHTRYSIPVSMMLEILDDDGNVSGAEVTVTENISLGGAAVFTTLDAEIGTFIRVTSEQYDVTVISVVRGKRMGTDSIRRLHLEFIDRYFPLQGIE